MKFSILIFAILLLPLEQFAQKKTLSIDDLGNNWPTVYGAKITNDGQYVLYGISGITNENERLVIEKTDQSWRVEVSGASPYNCIFSQDSRNCYYKKSDTIANVVLGTSKKSYFKADHFQLVKYGSDNDWLILQTKGQLNELIIIENKTGREQKFQGIVNYQFSKDGKHAVFFKQQQSDSVVLQTTYWYNAESDELVNIWQGNKVFSWALNDNGDQIAFIGRERLKGESFILCFKDGQLSAKKITSADTISTDKNSRIDQIKSWSSDNERIFVNIKIREKEKAVVAKSNVEILNAANINIDFTHAPKNDNYLAALNLSERNLIQLEKQNETFLSIGDGKSGVLIIKGPGGSREWGWNRSSWVSLGLESAINGHITPIKDSVYSTYFWPLISLKGKYVIYYDGSSKNYFSYSVSSGAIVNITKGVDAKWTPYYSDDRPDSKYKIMSAPLWFDNDEAVLLQDQYDIWKVDPAGIQKPINVTNYYGRDNHIYFQPAFKKQGSAINKDEEIILSGFDRIAKEDGFYKVKTGKSVNPYPLTIGKYIYNGPRHPDIDVAEPIQARDAKAFLVMRMSEDEAPNFFFTQDFKEFKQVSTVRPHVNYNWVTTKLISYKDLNRVAQQGVLYKPENFDPLKKYPVIIHYYEHFADRLHAYLIPKYNIGDINIPYYVSNGYVVFTPDIKYKVGEPGKSALDNVVGIYNYLKTLKFIDVSRIAIQGHSFGGFETNYIASHTNLFACALSASGPIDLISSYNSFWWESVSAQDFYENEQGRIGASLWERPDLFIKNSPIFSVDKINKPLLLMHNRNDKIVNFKQTEEFYLALRRLKKTAWVLQYNNSGHVVEGPIAQRDFTIRATQYFDHYLKGYPPPVWMTKIGDAGYELDSKGICSKECSVCKMKDYNAYFKEIKQTQKY